MKKPVNDFAPLVTEVPRFLEYDENLPGELSTGRYYRNYLDKLQIARIAQDLMRHDFKLPFSGKFYGKPSRPFKNLEGLRMVRVLRHLALAMEERQSDAFWDCHEVCPDVDLIVKVAKAAAAPEGGEVDDVGHVAPIPYQEWQFDLLKGDALIAAHDAINNLAIQLRKALMSKKVRSRIKNFKRNATDRYKQLLKVAVSAWARNNSNLLIRLDWGYRKKYPVISPEFLSQEDFEARCEEVSRFRKIMLNILQEKFGKNLSFYAWKIECGDVKGLHIHWLLAINGNKHQDRINVPRQIAEAWDAAIGHQGGYTRNINADDTDGQSGLRVLEYREAGLLDVLGVYCDYLTKIDYTLKFRMPEGMRSFGCSKLPKIKKNKPGPARKYQMQTRDLLEVRGPQGNSSFKSTMKK